MTNSYSKMIAARIGDFLMKDDWHYQFNEENGVFTFTLSINSRIKSINYFILVNGDCFTVYGRCPIGPEKDDKEMMGRISEFICRANYGLKNGNFEMDFDDGEMSYKSFVDCEDLEPSAAVIRNSIYAVSSMIKRYAPGFLSVLFGNESAEDAVRRCEQPYQLLEQLLEKMEESDQQDGSEGKHDSDNKEDADHLDTPEDLDEWGSW